MQVIHKIKLLPEVFSDVRENSRSHFLKRKKKTTTYFYTFLLTKTWFAVIFRLTGV